jgi:hypothetical protein
LEWLKPPKAPSPINICQIFLFTYGIGVLEKLFVHSSGFVEVILSLTGNSAHPTAFRAVAPVFDGFAEGRDSKTMSRAQWYVRSGCGNTGS